MSVSRREPIFNVPGSVLGLLAVMLAVHLVREALAEPWYSWVTVALAFVPARYTELAAEIPGDPVAEVTSFLSYAFVHADYFHLGINAAWMLVFGGAVAQRVGSWRFLAFSAVTAIAAAMTFLVFNLGLLAPMIGASGAVSGLMGGTMRFLFTALDNGGVAALRETPREIPLMSLSQALIDRRVILVTLAFIVANFLGLLGFGTVSQGGIAWEAHLGGYFAGLFAFGFFDRAPTLRSPAWPSAN